MKLRVLARADQTFSDVDGEAYEAAKAKGAEELGEFMQEYLDSLDIEVIYGPSDMFVDD